MEPPWVADGAVGCADRGGDAPGRGARGLHPLNAPLARLCLVLLRNRRPARIEGRDISRTLATLIARQKVDTVPALLDRLAVWVERKRRKLEKRGGSGAEARIQTLEDELATIEALAEGLTTVAERQARIAEIFADGRGPAITLSTVHRAKGLEADRVWVLAPTLYCYGKRAEDPEEAAIHYVAITRAKQTLVLVDPTATWRRASSG